jgi:hypothetical protein
MVLPGEVETEQHLRDPARRRRQQRQEQQQLQQQPVRQPSVSEDSAADSLPLPLRGAQLTTQRCAARHLKARSPAFLLLLGGSAPVCC